MSAVRATIHAGVCGFVSHVTATSEDEQLVRFEIETLCENVQRLAAALPEVDAYAEVGAGFDGQLHQPARATLRGCCSGCVVPAGLFRAMQVRALRLPE